MEDYERTESDDDLRQREEAVLRRLEEIQETESQEAKKELDPEKSIAEQVESGETKTIDLDEFRARTEEGSVCDFEPRSHSSGEMLDDLSHGRVGDAFHEVQEGIEHVAHDFPGWVKSGVQDLELRLKGEKAFGEEDVLAHPEIHSAEAAFEKYGIEREGHFGLEVEIEADNEIEANERIRDALATMGFEDDHRPGDGFCGEQFWRDQGEDQEHLRYYGLVDEGDGHYRAIFIGEKQG